MSAPGRIDSLNNYFYTGGSAKFIHEMSLSAVLPPEITIPASVTSIAEDAFEGCRSGARLQIRGKWGSEAEKAAKRFGCQFKAE